MVKTLVNFGDTYRGGSLHDPRHTGISPQAYNIIFQKHNCPLPH